MKDDNIVEFPTTQNEVKEKLAPEETAKKEQENMVKVLEQVDKNKTLGLSQLQNSVNQQEGRTRHHSDAKGLMHIENTIRMLEKGVGGALTTVEALNSLIDMIRHDMVAMFQNIQQIQHAAVVNNTQVNLLLKVLEEKGMINEEEMKKKFKELTEEAK